ncbi:MAG: hypothetical protein ABII22_02765 [Candidatus Micrarchaeota archaeon]
MKLKRMDSIRSVREVSVQHRGGFLAACTAFATIIASSFIPSLAHAGSDCAALQQNCIDADSSNAKQCRTFAKRCGIWSIDQKSKAALVLENDIATSLSQISAGTPTEDVTAVFQEFQSLRATAEKSMGKLGKKPKPKNIAAVTNAFDKVLAKGQEAKEKVDSLDQKSQVPELTAQRLIDNRAICRSMLSDFKERLDKVGEMAAKQKKKIDFADANLYYKRMKKSYDLALKTEHVLLENNSEVTNAQNPPGILTLADLTGIADDYTQAVASGRKLEVALAGFEATLFPKPKDSGQLVQSVQPTALPSELLEMEGMQWAGSQVLGADWAFVTAVRGIRFNFTPDSAEYADAQGAENLTLDTSPAKYATTSVTGLLKLSEMFYASLGYGYIHAGVSSPFVELDPENPLQASPKFAIFKTTEHRFLLGPGLLFNLGDNPLLLVPKFGYSMSSSQVQTSSLQGVDATKVDSTADGGSSSGLVAEFHASFLMKRMLASLDLSNNPSTLASFSLHLGLPNFTTSDMRLSLDGQFGTVLSASEPTRVGDSVTYKSDTRSFQRIGMNLLLPLLDLSGGSYTLALDLGGSALAVDGESTSFAGSAGVAFKISDAFFISVSYDSSNAIFACVNGRVEGNGAFTNVDWRLSIPSDINNLVGSGRTSFGRAMSEVKK